MKLCKSHITVLEKVRNQLSMKQTMNYIILIISKENSEKIQKAKDLIENAINLLSGVE